MSYHRSVLGAKALWGLAVVTVSQALMPTFSKAMQVQSEPVTSVAYVVRSMQDGSLRFSARDSLPEMEIQKDDAPNMVTMSFVISPIAQKNAPDNWIHQPEWPKTSGMLGVTGLVGFALARRYRRCH